MALPSKLKQLGWGMLVPLGLILLSALVFLADPAPLQTLRNSTFDQYQRWHPRAYQDGPVRIIDIDDESLRRLGQWPWPRSQVAHLLGKLQDAEPAAITFDFIFAEPDRTSPKAMLNLWSVSPATHTELAQLPDHDAIFAKTLERGGVVLGLALETSSKHTEQPKLKARYIISGETPQPYLHNFASAVNSLPILENAAAGAGATTFIPDADGVLRKAPLLLRIGDTLVPSLSAETLRVAQKARNYTTRTVAEKGVGLAEIRIGRMLIPTTPNGEVWVHYTRPDTTRYIPAWKVMAGEVPHEALAGRILLLGTSAQGLMDLRFSPLGGVIPGIEVHAQMLEQVLTGDGLSRPSWATAIEILAIVGGGLVIGIIALSTGAIPSFLSFAVLLALLWGLAWNAFTRYGLLLDATLPSLSLVATFLCSSVVRHLSSERRQRWIKEAFSRYVSPNLVSYLVKQPEALELGGRRQQCSFVFTDLVGFTTLMEDMDPGAAVALLNDYLDRMIAIAFAHDGTLDRIVGDAVAIMFSAPVPQADHQRRALACAMEMQKFTRQYVIDLAARGIRFGQTRIGIHSGEVIVGNFGGTTMFDYRALGDPVNTASRLEGANKYLGTLVCVSEATLAGCADWPVRPIGRIVLKGKSHPLAVFEPLDGEPGKENDDEYLYAFELLRAEKPEALSAFEALAVRRPTDALLAFHLGRLRAGKTGDLIVMSDK